MGEGSGATHSRRLAAIFAADVVGSTSLIEHDEQSALAAIRKVLFGIVAPEIRTFGGRLFKNLGDGLLAEFPSPVAAVRCAIEVQQKLWTERDREQIRIRIGINTGDIVVAPDGDLLGDGVNIAARLEGVAEPGGIAISGKVQEELAGKLDCPLRDLGHLNLKGLQRQVRVFAWPANR